MAYKNFVPDVLSSSEVQTYLMNQSVMVFANSTARSAALTAPTEGMVTYLQDVNALETYNGSAWVGLTTSNLIVGPTSNSQGMGIRPYAIAGIGGAAYGVYMGSQTYASNYGNGYVLWSNGSQTYVRGNNITMYAGTEVDDTSWVQMETNRVRIAANYNVGFDMDLYGRIKMTEQPRFLISTSGYNFTGGAWRDISTLGGAFSRNVEYNVGSHWNTTTGLFTAPVAGYYLFYAGGWANYNGAGNRYAISFHINAGIGGDWRYISGANTSAVDTPLAMSPVVRYMQAGWYMRTAMFSSVTMQLGTSSHHFYYGGYLLG